ncbi:hypothetical protein AB4K20DRAFT_1946005 [Rhizopus microsporus]
MKQAFFGKAVLAIIDHSPYYKAFLKSLEEEGYELTGYKENRKKKKKMMCESDY